MIGRTPRQPRLLDRYWSALRFGRGQPSPPPGLDPDLARMAEVLARESAQLEPGDAFLNDLRRRLASQATSGAGRGWTMPALDPRRRSLPVSDDTEEHDMSRPSSAPLDEPVDIRQRLGREWMRFAAAVLVFLLIGTVLVLTFRDNGDDQVGAPPAITPTMSPTPEATTPATAVTLAATPTDAPQPSAPATEPVPAPVVMDPPGADLPLAGQVSATIPVGIAPSAIAAGHGAIWVYNDIDGTVTRIDPATNTVVATIPVATPLDPARPPNDLFGLRLARTDLAIDAASVWAIKPEEQAVVRIDPVTNQVVAMIALPAKAMSIAVDGSSLWVAHFATNSVTRIDTATAEVVATIRDVPQPAAIAVAPDAVWVTNYFSDAVTRIDPVTNQVVARVSVTAQSSDPNCGVCALEVLTNEHGIWVSLSMVDAIARIDPATNQLVAIIPVGIQPRSLASDARGVWVGNQSSTGVLLIDPASNQVVAAVPATEAPTQLSWITLWENTLWVARPPGNDVVRIDLHAE